VRGAEEVCVGGARDGGLSCSAQEPARFRVVVPGRFAFESAVRGAEVAQVLLSAFWLCRCMCPGGDTVIRAASRSRLSAYRDFDFYDDDCPAARGFGDSPPALPPRAGLPAHPDVSDVWGRSRELSMPGEDLESSTRGYVPYDATPSHVAQTHT
jgi:hypothetical protein